jgi:hypothetical protein
MARDLAIILNNGSVNSAVVTAMAAQKYRPVMLYVDTIGNPASRAKQAYDTQVAHFKPYREHTIGMPFMTVLDERPSSAPPPADPRLSAPLGPQLSQLLPLISAAGIYAIHYQAAAIYLGLRVGPQTDELAQATEYVQIWNELIQQPCAHGDLEVNTPILELEPWQVIDVGVQVSTPFERTWSCFDENADACWACSQCRAREQAFQQAGKPDPLRAGHLLRK